MKMMTEEEETKEEQTQPDEATKLYQKLYILWRKAIIKQKNQLMGQVLEAKQGWQRFKWLLEKKMEEWQPKDEQEPQKIDWSNCNYKLGMTFS